MHIIFRATQILNRTLVRGMLALLLGVASLWAAPASAQTTVVDSIALNAGSWGVSGTTWLGSMFQTGPGSTNINEVSFSYFTVAPGTVTLRLYNVDGTNFPAGAPVATAVVPSVAGVNTYNTAALGAIATATLAPSQKYALIVSQPSGGVDLADNNFGAANAYTFAGGFSAAGTGYAITNNAGASWGTQPGTPAFQLKITAAVAPTPQSIPTLGFWAMVLMALLLLGLARRQLR